MLSLTDTTGLYPDDGPPEIPVPYNLEAEEAVLGSLLLDRDAIIKIEPFLLPGDFYRETNGWIYQAVLDLYRRREPPDLVTLSSELGRRRVGKTPETRLDAVGGPAYLAALMHTVPHAGHIEYYARLVERTAVLRRLISVGGEIAGLGYEEGLDLPIVLDKAESLLLGVTQRQKRGAPPVTLQAEQETYMTNLADRMDHGASVGGWTTGLPTLDNLLTGGLRKRKFYVVLGESGGGKSTFGMGVALAATQAGARLGFYSLEMGGDELAELSLAHDAEVDSMFMAAGTISEDEYRRLEGARAWRADQPPFRLVSGGGFTLRDITAQARAWVMDGGLDILVVDYLGLVKLAGRGDNKVNELDDLLAGLKALGMELGIAVLTFSQISRSGHGLDPAEWIHHARGTGGIAQNADVVLAVAPDGDRPADGTQSWPIKIHVSKQRRGAVGIVPALWWLAYSKMGEVDPRYV